MNPDFRNAIMAMSGDDTGKYYFRKRKIDYHRLIVHGAWTETGNNHYIFLYRDAFESNEAYGGIYFLYHPFAVSNPVQVGFKGPDSLREAWNIYLKAAVHFLKNNLQNTMAISALGHDKQLLDLLKQIAGDHEIETAEKIKKFSGYNFSVLNRRIEAREMELRIPTEKRPSVFFTKELKLLKPEQPDKKPAAEGKAKARMGLSLVLESEGDHGRNTRFQPVILPIKKRDGAYAGVKPAVRSQMKNYDFEPFPAILDEFMAHLHEMSAKRTKYIAKMDTVSQVYFEPLVNLLEEMPDELTFCQLGRQDNPFHPLKAFTFKKLDIWFAPEWHGDDLRFLLVLTAADRDQNEGGDDDGHQAKVLDAAPDYRIIISGNNRVYLFFRTSGDAERYYLAIPEEPAKFERCFRFLAEVKRLPLPEFPIIRDALQQTASDCLAIHPDPLPFYHLTFKPIPVLNIQEREVNKKLPCRIEVEFDYQSGADAFMVEHPHIRLVHYVKDDQFETMCLYLLKNDPLLDIEYKRDWHGDVSGYYFTFANEDELDWLVEQSPQYLAKGFKIYSARRGQYIGKTDSRVRLDVNPGQKWLEFKPLLQSEASGETYEIARIDFSHSSVTDQDGTLHLVKTEDREKLVRLSHYAEHTGSVYRVPSRNYFLINFLYDRRTETFSLLKESLLTAGKLEKFKQIPDYPLSGNVNAVLREYQTAGFKWLRFLHEYDLPGCLADDMGLGKTLQTLALLRTLKDLDRLDTSLLVLPVSAVLTWEAEIEKFTPGLTLYRHLGANRQNDPRLWAEHDLVMTSYATLRNDIQTFKDFPFDYIILDESQAIKNPGSQVTRAIKILKGAHRLALSGTPIENTSMELWSLFDFLMPGFLGTPQWFKKHWALPVEKYKDNRKAGVLKKMIYPFIMRRKKEDVEKDLPEKIEIIETLEMEEEQLKLYAATAKYYSESIGKAIDEEGLEKSSIKILEGMLRLRQICLFPRLVNAEYGQVPSVKFDHLSEMMEDILAEGHNVLVFSQFVSALGMIRNHFEEQGVGHAYLDGSVPLKKRQEMVKAFQENEETRVFLLSLKAGGVALNLTAADYVIIFDPWWNPAVEAQAIDRSHRIGQTRNVFVYRLVVKDTIEEKMLALQEQKKELVEKLITSESKVFKDLTRDDIMSLFQFAEQKL
jgi:hypothetical protein